MIFFQDTALKILCFPSFLKTQILLYQMYSISSQSPEWYKTRQGPLLPAEAWRRLVLLKRTKGLVNQGSMMHTLVFYFSCMESIFFQETI